MDYDYEYSKYIGSEQHTPTEKKINKPISINHIPIHRFLVVKILHLLWKQWSLSTVPLRTHTKHNLSIILPIEIPHLPY